MITNPSCQSESKDVDSKFHGGPHFEDELGDIGPNGGVGQPGLTDLGGYGGFVGGHAGGHHGHGGHYNGHYYNSWAGHHQPGPDYGGYYGGGPGGQIQTSQPGQYYGGGGGGGHYSAPGLGYSHQDQWSQGPGGPMVVPPGPSPTGSTNSPSPHGFSDNNDNTELRPGAGQSSELKRPSPDNFVPHVTSLGPGHPPGSLHHGPSLATQAAKKPKVSKRRKKRDPNEPQKPVSAYALFFRDTQASIKLRNPSANFGEVSKIVAATWDALDPESKAAYKKRTEMAKKEYLRALAAYRANMVSKGSGHDLYGGFPGYSPMMFNGSGVVEQAMPATGLGLVPGNISPGSGLGPQGPPQMVQGLPPHYNGSYHPSYMQQPIQIQHGNHGGSHLQQSQHSPGPDQVKMEIKMEDQVKMEIKMEDQLGQGRNHDNYENGHFRGSAPGTNGPVSHYPPHTQSGQYPGYHGHQGPQQGSDGGGGEQTGPRQYSNKCGNRNCRNYTPGHSDYCTSECVVGECKEVYDNWSSCMVKPGANTPGQGPNPDVMVK